MDNDYIIKKTSANNNSSLSDEQIKSLMQTKKWRKKSIILISIGPVSVFICSLIVSIIALENFSILDPMFWIAFFAFIPLFIGYVLTLICLPIGIVKLKKYSPADFGMMVRQFLKLLAIEIICTFIVIMCADKRLLVITNFLVVSDIICLVTLILLKLVHRKILKHVDRMS